MKSKKDSFSSFILLSFLFHGIILAFLTIKVIFFPSESLDYQKSVRVDVVALPEKQKETPKPAPEKPKPAKKEVKQEPKKVDKPKPKITKKPKPKKAPKVVLDKKKVQEEQNSAIARLKAMQKLKAKQQAAQKKQEFKGNNLSKGNSLTGLEKLHHESYLEELDNHIRSFWNLPEWLADGSLKASVLLLINKNGGLKGKSFISKSGNEMFDQHILSTLEKASPLPPPPTGLINFYATKGVEIRFPE